MHRMSGRLLPNPSAAGWATRCRSPSAIIVSTCSCDPRVFRRASQGPRRPVVPLRGVHGKAR
eukprot:scaffold65680_cov67-Phaeocystis_antarctica.AAC.2